MNQAKIIGGGFDFSKKKHLCKTEERGQSYKMASIDSENKADSVSPPSKNNTKEIVTIPTQYGANQTQSLVY